MAILALEAAVVEMFAFELSIVTPYGRYWVTTMEGTKKMITQLWKYCTTSGANSEEYGKSPNDATVRLSFTFTYATYQLSSHRYIAWMLQ